MSRGRDVAAVICASTGDTSASVSAYCAAAGIPSVVLLPRDRVSVAQLIQPLANGAITLALDTDFDGCMALVKRLSEDPRFYLANSVNPLRIEGQKTVSIEITQQDDWEVPDWVIVPGGEPGQHHGHRARLPDDARPGPHPAASAPGLRPVRLRESALSQLSHGGSPSYEPVAAVSTAASAIQIGNPVSVGRAIPILKEFDGIVEQATEDELAHAAAQADRTGLFSCPQTGVALAAMSKLVDRKEIGRGDRVIVISTANGLKFVDFKVDYHNDNLADVTAKLGNKPVELPGDYESVVGALASELP